MKRSRLLLTLMLLAGSRYTPPAQASDDVAKVIFLTPRRFEAPAGPSTATIDVVPPAGASVASVAFIADGVPIGSRSAPPWTFDWDAGDGTREHLLEAVAAFSNGTLARASLASGRRVVIDNEIAAPVTLYAIARGAEGAYVLDLKKDDFRLYDNGREQGLDRFSAERGPLRVAIALDASASMKGDKLKEAIAAAVAFLGELKPIDEGLIVSFSDQALILESPTADRRKLESALRSVAAHGGSSLYDAVCLASERLSSFSGRRVLLLLTDGRDEAESKRVAASAHTLEEARDRVIRNNVMVFVIALGSYLAHDADALAQNAKSTILEWNVGRTQPVAAVLTSLAQATGGSILFTPHADDLRQSFDRIADDLRHHYVLAYRLTDKKRDDSWREIKVVVERPRVSVATRTGYFASPEVPGQR